ncbi:MAG: OmpA family protein [Chitinophagaceae bacterium]
MAELNVQPKKKSILPWILLLLGVLALLFFLFRSCNDNTSGDTAATTDTTVVPGNESNTDNGISNDGAGAGNGSMETVAATSGWEGINYNAPPVSYDEVTDKNIEVRSDDKYTIYSLGENILFDVDKSGIRTQGGSNLKQISESIAKRYGSGDVKVFGYTDAVGTKSYNKKLAEDRAESVRTWLVQNGNISENRISTVAVGEARPAATNSTSEGRQQNRRVEIIVKRS